MNGASPTATQNRQLNAWVKDMAELCQPERIHWCDGSEAEKISLTKQAVAAGVLTELNQEKLPGCYYHRSNPNDTARVEHCTFICTETAAEAGPTNNWAAPAEMYQKLYGLARGGMKGRTMFVVPYLMGPPGSPLAKIGVELTDSIYVVLSMRVMTRMGAVALAQLAAEMISTAACTACWTCIPTAGSSRIFRRTMRSSPSARITAAMFCSAKNVSHCGWVRISDARKAGWRNIC